MKDNVPFQPIILNIKKAPSHAVGRSVKQLGIKQIRGRKGDETNTHQWNIGWVDKASRAFFESLKLNQKINHLLGVEQLSKKRNLARTINPMVRSCPEEYSFMPRSWMFPSEKELFLQAYAQQREWEAQQVEKGIKITPRTYIVKPGSACQGRGIYLIQSPKDITSQNGIVVQEYINNPLLINNKKFDLRIYVAVTSAKPLRIYLYQDGLARFCTEDYVSADPSNLSQLFGHLTNYSLNKHNEHMKVESEELTAENQGYKWTLQYLNEYLSEQYGADRVRSIWTEIQHVMIKTLLAALPVMEHAYDTVYPNEYSGGHGFQLFGFDIMLDEHLKPWLIEVNRNPSLRCESILDQKIKTFLLGQLFYLLDPEASCVPSESLVKDCNELLGINKDLEARLNSISTNAQAKMTLNSEEYDIYQKRRSILELQSRLEHEDSVINTFFGIAARNRTCKDKSLECEVTTEDKDPFPVINLKIDKETNLPSFPTVWQPMYPIIPFSDYIIPPKNSKLVHGLPTYNGYLPDVITEESMKTSGICNMYPLYSTQEARERTKQYAKLVEIAKEHYKQNGSVALNEALNSKMGLGGPPTAPWTMAGGANAAASQSQSVPTHPRKGVRVIRR